MLNKNHYSHLLLFTVCLFISSTFVFAQKKQEVSVAVKMKTITPSAEITKINFFEGTWEEALAEAKKQNKPIFLDGYTSWCGPCKYMTKNIFTQKEVADHYNANYINVKKDMEKGDGIMLAEKYEIANYPTFVFFNPDGKATHRSIGAREAEPFVLLGKNALDETKQYFTLKAKYEAGDKSPELLHNYTLAYSGAAMGSSVDLADEYLATQTAENLLSEKNMDFVMETAHRGGKSLETLLSNKTKFEEAYESAKVVGMISNALGEKVRDAAMEGDEKAFQKVLDLSNNTLGEYAKLMNQKLSVTYYQMTQDWDKYATAAVAYIDNAQPADWNSYNNMAWTFFEKVEDKAMLEKAAAWAAKSIAIETNYYNTDTHAAILFKLGKKKEAMEAAQKAIKVAKENDINPKETQELLEKIENM